LSEYLVGTGGWAYFRIPGLNSLEAYSNLFNFVEVNSTFYAFPDIKMVESWRRRVPQDFEFSVRLNRAATHKYRLEPREETFKIFDYATQVCKTLGSELLVVQTPQTLEYNEKMIQSTRDLLRSLNLTGLKIAWEIRSSRKRLPRALINLMQEHKIIHCVDLSREEPSYESDQLYTRLFGKGEHNLYQFSDGELLEIDEKTKRKDYGKIAVSFHNVRMYKDAARYKKYKETGKFPSITRYTGLRSLRAVLKEDAKFPSTKEELIEQQGWKVIDMTAEKRVHVRDLLRQVPEKEYRDIDDIVAAVQSIDSMLW